MAKRDFVDFLLKSYENRPKSYEEFSHLMPILVNERTQYFKLVKGEFEDLKQILRKLQVLVLEKERTVVIYVIHNAFNMTPSMRCSLHFDDIEHIVVYLEVDAYFKNADAIMRAIVKIPDLILVNGLPHDLLRYDQKLRVLHAANSWEFVQNQSFNYCESLGTNNDFINWIYSKRPYMIPENLVISLAWRCFKCVRGFKNIECYCKTLISIHWETILGTNNVLEFLLLRSIATGKPLQISYTKLKFVEQLCLEGPSLQVQYWKARVIPRLEKSAYLRWWLWQNSIRGVARNVDQQITSEFLEYYPNILGQITSG